MKHTNITSILLFLIVLFSLSSCRKVFKRAEWAPEASFPIAYSDLTIQNLFSDTSNVQTDSNGLASIVFRQKLDSLTLSVLDTFSAPPFNRKFKLDSLKLTIPPFIREYTLGNMITSLINSGDQQNMLYGYALRYYHGSPLSSIPGQIPPSLSVPLGELPLSLNQFFQSAELKTGKLELSIENNFPLKIERMDFSIKNAGTSIPLVSESGISINVNSTFNQVYDLAGKSVEGNLLINIPILDLLTDPNAIVDTNAAVIIQMLFSNLTVTSAQAVFPDQDVVTDKQTVSLENMGDMELKEALISEGNLVMDVKSTIQDSIFITYSMPGTTQSGVPLVFQGVVPPATSSSPTEVRLSVPVKDYLFKFSYPPDYFNRFYYDFRAHVKNTGKIVNLNLNDSIEVNVYLKSVRPRYVRGYLGSLDTTISSTINSNLFSDFSVESFSPETVKLSLQVQNGLGVKGNVMLKSLSGSKQGGQSVQANDPELIGNDFLISPSTNFPFTESSNLLKSSPNSNFADLVSILPDRFEYVVEAQVGGLPKDTNSFVYNTSSLKPELLIELPLNLSVKGLVLNDTVSIDPSQVEIDNNGGVLRLLCNNGFPFTGNVQLSFISQEKQMLTLSSVGTMEAADLDPSTGRVKSPKFSKIEFRFDPGQLNFILFSKQLAIRATFNTPADKKVKIYSDYSARLTLTAKVSPKVSK